MHSRDRYTGVLECIEIRRSGFEVSLLLETLRDRFHMLLAVGSDVQGGKLLTVPKMLESHTTQVGQPGSRRGRVVPRMRACMLCCLRPRTGRHAPSAERQS